MKGCCHYSDCLPHHKCAELVRKNRKKEEEKEKEKEKESKSHISHARIVSVWGGHRGWHPKQHIGATETAFAVLTGELVAECSSCRIQ